MRLESRSPGQQVFEQPCAGAGHWARLSQPECCCQQCRCCCCVQTQNHQQHRKRVCVLCTHVQLESATDQWLRVFPERLVKALIHWFVSTSNLTQKRACSFSRTGKCLISWLMESLLTDLNIRENKNSQNLPQEAELVLYVMGKDLGMTEEQVWMASVSHVPWHTQLGLWNTLVYSFFSWERKYRS